MEAYAARPRPFNDRNRVSSKYACRNRSRIRKDQKITDASGRKQAAITDIRIHHIETVPMTAAQYARAVEALAVLIARYEREHPDDDPDTA